VRLYYSFWLIASVTFGSGLMVLTGYDRNIQSPNGLRSDQIKLRWGIYLLSMGRMAFCETNHSVSQNSHSTQRHPLGVCRTIGAEAKNWLFETRFGLI